MSALDNKIMTELTLAIKSKDQTKISALRMLKSVLKNSSIAKMSELSEEDEIKAIRSEVKKRQDAMAGFKAGNRNEAAAAEEAEMKYLQTFLPAELNELELLALIDSAMSGQGFSMAQFGGAMKAVMPAVAGKADGARISALVKQRLTK